MSDGGVLRTLPNPELPVRAHPTALAPEFKATTIPTNAHINGVYAVLQGIREGQDNLMGGYGYLEWSNAGNCVHEGLDLNSMGGGDADLGARIVAPLGGVITDVLWWNGTSQGFGNHLAMWIDDPKASQQCFMHIAHLDTMAVTPGQRVAAGQPIATNGKSGRQPYAHAHTALWHEIPPGGWSFWQTGYSREWVASKTLSPEAWFWSSVNKAGQPAPPPEEALAMLEDWQLAGWIMADVWQWAGVPFNPDALTTKAWIAELRAGRYRGRPRTADRAYGDPQAGHWAEFDSGIVVTDSAAGEWSWQG